MTGTHDWHHECGIMAVSAPRDAADLARCGLFALQHRGEESAGVSATGASLPGLVHHRGMGLVGDAIPDAAMAELGNSELAIGHVRYGTTGESSLTNAQPLPFQLQLGPIAIAHNGTITNAAELRTRLEDRGAIFQTSSDTEVVAHLIARLSGDLHRRLAKALRMLEGGFALAVLGDGIIHLARDQHGLRPLVLGEMDGGWCAASESCAIDAIGGTILRDVQPGTVLSMSRQGIAEPRRFGRARPAACSFEHIYFARPDSIIDGIGVHQARKRTGAALWAEHPADADLVIGVPDSSLAAAMGYAAAGAMPYDLGLVKSHYVGRTFIQPTAAQRERGVQLKLAPLRAILAGRRVAMVDDSLVRGTTARRIVSQLRAAGALEVHVRIASPPVTHGCHYGIDTSRRDELLAAHASVEAIRAHIGADSLGFLSEPGLVAALEGEGHQPGPGGWCNACFTGRYPTAVAKAEPAPAREQVHA